MMLFYYLSTLDSPEHVELMTYIYKHYLNRMLSEAYCLLGNKHRAEDAVHVVFTRLAENLSLIESVPEPNRKAYLLVAVRNEALRMLKSETTLSPLDDACDYGQNDDYSDILDAEMDGFVFKKAKQAIATLDRKYSDILYLYYVENLTVAEISDVTGLQRGAVRQRISRGMDALRKKLKEDNVI